MGPEKITPTSALACISHQLKTNYENDQISAIIQTDLSAAFDTVDHPILIEKFEHYGVRGNEAEIFRSFLKERYQYIEIDSIKLDVILSNDCSVIQGSKLSALLYTIYTNEIPILHRLMYDNIFTKITSIQIPTFCENIIKHITFQYVDDSSNIIHSKNIEYLQIYMDHFFTLLENFYNINKLTLNSDKSKLIIICKNKFREATKNITLRASGYIIKQSNKIKILGIFITNGLSNEATISNIVSKVNYRMNVVD